MDEERWLFALKAFIWIQCVAFLHIILKMFVGCVADLMLTSVM